MVEAIEAALLAKVEWESAKAAFEAARSRNALRRTEIENLKALP
jgi:hypothetical protein